MTGRFALGTLRLTWSFIKNVIHGIEPGVFGFGARAASVQPRIVLQWWADLKDALHHMSAWVKNGSKLFGKNVQLSTQLVMK